MRIRSERTWPGEEVGEGGAQGLQSWQPVGDATLPSASARKDDQGVHSPGPACAPRALPHALPLLPRNHGHLLPLRV